MADPEQTAHNDANYALGELRRLLATPGIHLPEGKLPTERELTRDLGITRHALRRALVVLEAEGLIWRRQGAGTFVGSPSRELGEAVSFKPASTTFEEIVEARLRLEPQLAQLAAIRASESDIARLHELNRRAVSASDPESCELWDGAYHRQIALAAGNAMLLSLFDIVNRVRQDRAWQQIRAAARNGASPNAMPIAHHEGIIAAIAARDPILAGPRIRAHMPPLPMRLNARPCDTLLDGHDSIIPTSPQTQGGHP